MAKDDTAVAPVAAVGLRGVAMGAADVAAPDPIPVEAKTADDPAVDDRIFVGVTGPTGRVTMAMPLDCTPKPVAPAPGVGPPAPAVRPRLNEAVNGRWGDVGAGARLGNDTCRATPDGCPRTDIL